MNRKTMTMRPMLYPALVALCLVAASPMVAQTATGFGGVAHDSTQPVEAVSDRLSIDQSNGQAVFEGNVIIVQGDMRIAADRVEVLYSETETPRTVEKVIATGGVLITRGEDAAEGDWALYEISNSLLTMEGDVVVTQAGTTIAGDRMVMDMVSGNSTVDGRVRTVLIPDQQP